MASVAEFEHLLAKCADLIREHDKTVLQFQALPDCEFKREMLAKFEGSVRIARETEQGTRDALARERSKLN